VAGPLGVGTVPCVAGAAGVQVGRGSSAGQAVHRVVGLVILGLALRFEGLQVGPTLEPHRGRLRDIDRRSRGQIVLARARLRR